MCGLCFHEGSHQKLMSMKEKEMSREILYSSKASI